MKKTDHEKFAEWILKIFDKYKRILFLEQFSVKVRYDKDTDYMASKVHYPYYDATFLFSEDAIDSWKEDSLRMENVMVHEFCHLITDPFYCVAIQRHVDKTTVEEARERLTDHISQIVNKNFNLIKG
jgi:hypothetical protein